MNIVDEIEKLFASTLLSQKVDDRVTSFRFNSILSSRPYLTDIGIKAFLQNIPNKDDFKLSLKVDEQDAISFISKTYTTDFIKTFDEYFEHYEAHESIYLNIEIKKSIAHETINIYSWASFLVFIDSLPVLQFLDVLSNLNANNGCLNFKFLEKSLSTFNTQWLHFGYDFQDCQFQSKLHLIEANCYFNDIKKYPFTPDHFALVKRPSTLNALTEKLDVLSAAYSVISIFDHSKIVTSDNVSEPSTVTYRLNGYKLIQGLFSLDRTLIEKGKNYLDLYHWIYSSVGNVSDKIGVARNIISLYIKNADILADRGLIHSIKSAHQTYLKDNVASYLSLRSNILDELSWISQKSAEVIQNYLSAYKQSSLTFISFFISIFLLRTLNAGDFLKVFNDEVSIVAFAFLTLALIFLFFSRYTVLKERDRLDRKYSNLKDRYKDLLIEEDINKILNNDSEFNYEKDFINQRIDQYTWLWAVTIFILFITILLVSELNQYSFYY